MKKKSKHSDKEDERSTGSSRRSSNRHAKKNSIDDNNEPPVEPLTNADKLSASYLEKHSSKKDLARRLRNVVHILSTDEDIDPDDANDYPGLASLASILVTEYLDGGSENNKSGSGASIVSSKKGYTQSDKDVRLQSVVACMELFAIYAPNAPYDEKEILHIFEQTIIQIGNISHTTKSTPNNHYDTYVHIIELLAEVKIGVVLVEIAKTSCNTANAKKQKSSKKKSTKRKNSKKKKKKHDSDVESDDGNSDDDTDDDEVNVDADENIGTMALDLLCDLIRTLLRSVRVEHNAQITELCKNAITACLEEYYDVDIMIPIPILDELLTCIGEGPTCLVKQPNGKLIDQDNPSYLLAVSIVRKVIDRLSTPISHLLNGLLNNDKYMKEQSSISTSLSLPSLSSKATQNKGCSMMENLQNQDDDKETTVWSIIYELYQVSPSILTTVIGTVSNGLTSPDKEYRIWTVRLLGQLCVSSLSQPNFFAVQYQPCFYEWLRRSNDVEASIRLEVIHWVTKIFYEHGKRNCSGNNSVATAGEENKNSSFERNDSEINEVIDQINHSLSKLITYDSDLNVRLAAIKSVCDIAYLYPNDIISKDLLYAIAKYRVQSKNKQERRNALTGLVQIYYKHYIVPKLASIQKSGDDCNIDVILQVLGIDHAASDDGVKDEVGDFILDDKYSWMPTIVFECVRFTDAIDYEMRNRVVQIVDDILLGCDSPATPVQPSSKGGKKDSKEYNSVDTNNTSNDKKRLTPTSRAVGLVLITQSLNRGVTNAKKMLNNDDSFSLPTPPSGTPKSNSANNNNSNAFDYMISMFEQRANLQRAINNYIDARSSIKDCTPGTEVAFTAEAKAMEMLEIIASLTAPISSSDNNTNAGNSSGSVGNNFDGNKSLKLVLQKFHNLRDKHIFRILATIADPTHSTKARIRALDELVKRIKSAAGATTGSGKRRNKSDKETNQINNDLILWIKSLIRRCAMGNFINFTTIHHCILLAQECYHNNSINACAAFIKCVHTSVQIFPSLLSFKKTKNDIINAADSNNIEAYDTIVELFIDCCEEKDNKVLREITNCGLTTLLTSILSISTTHISVAGTKNIIPEINGLKENLSKSKKRGKKNTGNDSSDSIGEEDANIYDMLQTHLLNLCTRKGTPSQASDAVYTLATLARGTANGEYSNELLPFSDTAIQADKDKFYPLLKALASLPKLKAAMKVNSTALSDISDTTRIVTLLSALTALVKCAPVVFESEKGGRSVRLGSKVIQFVWESIVMGGDEKNDEKEEMASGNESMDSRKSKDDDDDDDDESSDDDSDGEDSMSKRKRQRGKKRTSKLKGKQTPLPKRKSSKKNTDGNVVHSTPLGNSNLLEDTTLSPTCQRLCAAIEFIVTHIRASFLISREINAMKMYELNKISANSNSLAAAGSIVLPQREHIQNVFNALCEIIQNLGLPPSNRDRHICKSRQDRAAIRQCASIHILRLCDSRLGLERQFLNSSMWHTLAGAFLDEEYAVRESIIEELGLMLIGGGKYCSSPLQETTQQQKQGSLHQEDAYNVYLRTTNKVNAAMAPALRFAALVILCTDDVTGRIGYISKANGNAANVGQKQSLRIKSAAHKCVTFLRKTCESTLLQCRALGQEGERKYETKLKMMVMPEFVVPYALHLLAHRRESPSTDVIVTDKSIKASKKGKDSDDGMNYAEKSEKESSNSSNIADEQSNHKVLRKRLKWLFEPLVQSLGESADNISFLLRMTEILGKYFSPVNVTSLLQAASGKFKRNSTSPKRRLSLVSNDDSLLSNKTGSSVATNTTANYFELSDAKLKTICTVAREVLLSFVKKDVDLTNHPGVIQLPSSLFKRRIVRKVVRKEQNNATLSSKATSSRAESKSSSGKKRSSTSSATDSSAGSETNLSAARNKRRKIVVEQGSVSESPRKSQKVQFSPAAVSRHNNRRKQRNSSLPTSIEKPTATAPEVGDDSDFGNLSPIRQLEDSPISTLGSVKTLGTTPPSILGSGFVRPGDSDDENISVANSSGFRTLKNRGPKATRISPRNRTRNTRTTLRDNEEDEANEVLTSVTQSTGESLEDASYLQKPEGKTRQASPDVSKRMARSKQSFTQASDASKSTEDTESKTREKSLPKRSSRSRRIPIRQQSNSRGRSSTGLKTSQKIEPASDTSSEESVVPEEVPAVKQTRGRQRASSRGRSAVGSKISKIKESVSDTASEKSNVSEESPIVKRTRGRQRITSSGRSSLDLQTRKKKPPVSDASSEVNDVSENTSAVKKTKGKKRTNSRVKPAVVSKTSNRKVSVSDTSSEDRVVTEKIPVVNQTKGRQRSTSKGRSLERSNPSKKKVPVSDTSSEESIVSEENPVVKQSKGRQRTTSRGRSSEGSKNIKKKESMSDTSSEASAVAEKAPAAKKTKGSKQTKISSSKRKRVNSGPSTTTTTKYKNTSGTKQKNGRQTQRLNSSSSSPAGSKISKKRKIVSDEFDFDFEEAIVRKPLAGQDSNRRLPSVKPKKRARKSKSM